MGEIIRRFRAMGADEGKAADDGSIGMVCSTADAVDWGGWREVLMHEPAAVDDSTCRALLVNHRADMIAGTVNAIERNGRMMSARASIMPGAKLPTDITVADAVKAGALRGVSIGYDYAPSDAEWDENTRTLTVRRWRLLEVSLTPIPADPKAGVRALPDWVGTRSTPTAPAVTRKAPIMEPTGKEPQVIPAAVIPPTIDEKSIRAESTAIARHAESLNLKASDYAGLSLVDARAKMLDDVATRGAKTEGPKAPATVTADESDKIVAQAVDAIVTRGGRGMFDVAERFEGRMGRARPSRGELGDLLARGIEGAFAPRHKRAVEVSANFTQVTALAAAKFIANGFDGYKPEYPKIAREIFDTSFKAVRVAGIQIAAFGAAPGEGSALADITIDDGGLSLTNEFRGGVVQLSAESIYNDELGMFFMALGDLGRVGARTLDKSVFTALEAASFASATSALAFSQANMGAAWALHAAITGPAGEVTGVPAKRVVVPASLYITAKEATTTAQGETTKRIFDVAGEDGIMPVRGWYLTDTNDWYLLCDPADAAALYLLRHPDYRNPKLVEIDSGAVPGRKFRIEFPHKAGVATYAAGKPVGGYKATQP